MGSETIGQMNLKIALRLGRVSNLPTVWTNCLAGAVLAGGTLWDFRIIVIILATSLFYIAGMFLNDAFDWRHDKIGKSDRPIPQNLVTPKIVLKYGFVLMAIGFTLLILLTPFLTKTAIWYTLITGLLLCLFIIIYDLFHKSNPYSPLFMGVCRMLIYYIAGFALTGALTIELIIGSGVLFLWVIGITYFAKQKVWSKVNYTKAFGILVLPITVQLLIFGFNFIAAIVYACLLSLLFYISYYYCFKPNKSKNTPVAILIASISLIDAIFIMSSDVTGGILVSMGFLITLVFQQKISGT